MCIQHKKAFVFLFLYLEAIDVFASLDNLPHTDFIINFV